MIRWHRLDPAKVERAIKVLIRILHSDAEAMDGSGGDGGRDSTWLSPEGRVIFEVKSYSERLKPKQVEKIKGSLAKAAKHKQIKWVLILPLDHSPAEDRWWDDLKKKYAPITLEWRGIDWLDGEFAVRDYLRRYVEGSEYTLLQLAKEFEHEQAVLAGGLLDAAQRFAGLQKRIHDLSLHWKADLSVGPHGPLFTFTERYPGAADEDPIGFNPRFSFPRDDPEAEATERQLRRALDYGGHAKVAGRFIEQFDIEASEETRRAFGWDQPSTTTEFQIVSMESNEGLPLPCTLDVITSEEVVVASLPMQITRRTIGQRGAKLVGTDVSGVLTMTLMVDHPGNPDRTGTFGFDAADVVGRLPYAVRPVADFLLAVVPGVCVQLRLGRSPFGYVNIDEDYVGEASLAARLVVAFDTLQEYFGQEFPIPDGLKIHDLRELEMLVELVNTGKAQWVYHGIRAHVLADRLEALLAMDSFRSGEGAIVARFGSFGMEFGGHRFDLGAVQFYGPMMRLTNMADLLAAVGTGIAPEARWQCMDGEHIYVTQMTQAEFNAA